MLELIDKSSLFHVWVDDAPLCTRVAEYFLFFQATIEVSMNEIPSLKCINDVLISLPFIHDIAMSRERRRQRNEQKKFLFELFHLSSRDIACKA